MDGCVPGWRQIMNLLAVLPKLTVVFALAGATFRFVSQRGISFTGACRHHTTIRQSHSNRGHLLFCAFDTSLVASLADVGIYIAEAVIALLVVGLRDLWK